MTWQVLLFSSFALGREFFWGSSSIGILLRPWSWLQRASSGAGRVPSFTFSDERLGWLFGCCVAVLYIFPWDALDTPPPFFFPHELLYINPG
jgi:hypothetical protein